MIMRNGRWWVPTGLAAVALIGTACGSAATSGSASPAASPNGTSMSTAKIGSATVLTTAKGFTVYTFAKDTTGKSNCNGSCAHYWPPVKGPEKVMSGVTGKFATITRSDGSTQETWNGHPIYTYIGDTAPGQNKGNNLNLSGGIWHEVTVAGTASSSGTGGGSGY
jgi:predicted lipoprotein with Yx(FWY)xxD motif